MDNKLIKVLTKNSVKCLICNTILESKHRHDFVMWLQESMQQGEYL